MMQRGLVDPDRLLSYFETMFTGLERYPAVDRRAFRRRVEAAVPSARKPSSAP
jgi:hypothetical protein